MLPLSPNAAKAVEKLFFAEQRQEVVRLLTEKCADNLPNCKDQDEYGLEDRRFQVLKLSGENIDKLHDAIRMANEDWRDVMLAAGSATAYKRKLLGVALRSLEHIRGHRGISLVPWPATPKPVGHTVLGPRLSGRRHLYSRISHSEIMATPADSHSNYVRWDFFCRGLFCRESHTHALMR